MKIVGESIFIPKKLADGMEWNNGKVSLIENNKWLVESNGREITIDTSKSIITRVRIGANNKFDFEINLP
jgi:hypothetical protein